MLGRCAELYRPPDDLQQAAFLLTHYSIILLFKLIPFIEMNHFPHFTSPLSGKQGMV
jgi:hypothetical protein